MVISSSNSYSKNNPEVVNISSEKKNKLKKIFSKWANPNLSIPL